VPPADHLPFTVSRGERLTGRDGTVLSLVDERTTGGYARVSTDPGERDCMDRAWCMFQLILDPADLGNDSLPDAVVKHLRNDALRSDI
jgi:hypothetical protein